MGFKQTDSDSVEFDFNLPSAGGSLVAQSTAIVDASGNRLGLDAYPLVVAPQNKSHAVYSDQAADSGVIRATPGELVELRLLVTEAAPLLYFQLFNTTSVPADTALPIWCDKVPAGGQISESFTLVALPFAAGVCWALSTTQDTLTVTSSSYGSVYALHGGV